MFRDTREQIEYACEDCADCTERFRKPLMLLALISVVMTIKTARSGIASTRMGGSFSSYFQDLPGFGGLGGSDSGYGAAGGMYGAGGYGMTQEQATADLCDTYGSTVKVALGGVLNDYGGKTTFQGEIETLKSVESAQPIEEYLQITPGNGKILVIDGGGSTRAAIFDLNMAQLAERNGWQGIIVNGCIRNAQQMKSVQIGVKAIGSHPAKARGNSSKQGKTLSFAGVSFHRGNFVYADDVSILFTYLLIYYDFFYSYINSLEKLYYYSFLKKYRMVLSSAPENLTM